MLTFIYTFMCPVSSGLGLGFVIDTEPWICSDLSPWIQQYCALDNLLFCAIKILSHLTTPPFTVYLVFWHPLFFLSRMYCYTFNSLSFSHIIGIIAHFNPPLFPLVIGILDMLSCPNIVIIVFHLSTSSLSFFCVFNFFSSS